MLSVFIFRISTALGKWGTERDEERRSLRGRGILLLTLVSQLNPLAGAINILVMMSDEPPRGGRRSGSEEDELLSHDVKVEGEREKEQVKKKRGKMNRQTDK